MTKTSTMAKCAESGRGQHHEREGRAALRGVRRTHVAKAAQNTGAGVVTVKLSVQREERGGCQGNGKAGNTREGSREGEPAHATQSEGSWETGKQDEGLVHIPCQST